jgi:hypothetical protein
MNNYILHLVIWAVLTIVVICLAIYRKRVAGKADEILHVLDAEASLISTQAEVARKTTILDRWGKILTVLSVLYLLAIAATYVYTSLTQDTTVKYSG